MSILEHSGDWDRLERAYDSPPWWYDLRGFFILTFAYRSTLWTQVGFFAPHLGSRHLEAAIGSGTFFELVLRWRRWKRMPQPRIVGFDYAPAMLAGARTRFANQPGLQLLQADLRRLEFPDASFDSASIANALHCVPAVEEGLRELWRVLKPGGALVLNVLLHPRGPAPLRWLAARINTWGIRKGILETPYERADIEGRIRAAGFTIEAARVTGNVLMLIARRPGEPATGPAPAAR